MLVYPLFNRQKERVCEMDFGHKLALARRDAGMTQEELAAAVQVTRTTISSWERGRTRPDLDSLRLLSAALKCDLFSSEAKGKPEEAPSKATGITAARACDEAPVPVAAAARKRRTALIVGALVLLFMLAVCFALFLLPTLRDDAAVKKSGDVVYLGPTDLPGAVEMGAKDLLLSEPEVFTIEWFKQDNPIASGEPYIEFRTKLSVIGPETSSAGVTMWDWTMFFYEMTGRPFTLTRVDEYGFSSRYSYQHYSYHPGNLWYEEGPDAHWEFGGRMPVQPFQGYGYIIYGTDEAGNDLSFSTWFDLSTAPRK